LRTGCIRITAYERLEAGLHATGGTHNLRGIYEYIAFSLLEPATAKKQTRRIMDAAAKLKQMPLRHQLYQKEPWRSKGLRVLHIDNYLAFYLPIEAL
jgi:toxin ParE1/3/4